MQTYEKGQKQPSSSYGTDMSKIQISPVSILKCKRVTNFALSLENKPDITVRKFIFH